MSIRHLVSNELIERDGIYHLGDKGEFAYSDGDAAEASLLNVLDGIDDVSSRSRELEAHAKDWISRYHFARSRSLAYQSLEIPSNASVLEIGSGSGSITRLLGERAGTVLAIEGSPRRAAMTRQRTRDLPDVSVLCASFEEIHFLQTFDIIVCNGVLEYASLFVSGSDPAARMVEMFSRLLKPGGTLLVAIENKLGLRYFNSAREEHTGIIFDGIEGYARHPSGPRTFGRAELEALLRRSFASIEFLLPLPDYKFPQALVRECLLQEVSCSELFASIGNGYCGTALRPMLHERLAWHQIGLNKQLANTSNSFFVLASQVPSPLLESSWRGDIYSINRRLGFEIRTRISAAADGSISTQKTYLHQSPAPTPPFIHRLETSVWMGGESMHTAISRVLLDATASSSKARLHALVLKWWQAVTDTVHGDAGGDRVAGTVLDLNWENSILLDDRVHFIDREWVMDGDMSAHWLLYRTVSKFLDAEWNYRHRWDRRWRNISKRKLLKYLAVDLGMRFSLRKMLESIRLEEGFQHTSSGRSRSSFRVLIEDCMPFWFIFSWKEWGLRLSRFKDKVKRNVRRRLLMRS